MKKIQFLASLTLLLGVLANACSDDGSPEPATTGDNAAPAVLVVAGDVNHIANS
jgi:hypothetical protein